MTAPFVSISQRFNAKGRWVVDRRCIEDHEPVIPASDFLVEGTKGWPLSSKGDAGVRWRPKWHSGGLDANLAERAVATEGRGEQDDWCDAQVVTPNV